MTVLVTGAAGFLGSHVTELLLERGDFRADCLHLADVVLTGIGPGRSAAGGGNDQQDGHE